MRKLEVAIFMVAIISAILVDGCAKPAALPAPETTPARDLHPADPEDFPKAPPTD